MCMCNPIIFSVSDLFIFSVSGKEEIQRAGVVCGGSRFYVGLSGDRCSAACVEGCAAMFQDLLEERNTQHPK